jgi:hypothetical protein
MDIADFRASLADDSPRTECSPPLQALWWAAKGDWNKAHQVAQTKDDRSSAWVHAYLHRVEGDLSNAGYWYRRAQRTPESGALDVEWEAIAAELLRSDNGHG